MRFAHIGDAHIGASNFKLEERKLDFYRVFEEAIDNCIENNVDIVVQTGDLFDTGRPAVQDIVFAIEQLSRLKKIGIPFFTVPGSHDVYLHETPISILEKLGLVINVGSSKYFEQTPDATKHIGEVYGNYFVAGMPGYRSNVKKRYENLKIDVPDNKFSIFIFHHIVTSAPGTEFFSDIPMTLLPVDFNYYAGGHWHRQFTGEYNGAPVIYPGAIEHTDSAEMENVKERGMYIVDIESKLIKPKWIPFVTRDIVTMTLKFKDLNPREIVSRAIREIPKTESGSILLLRLKGNLVDGRRSEINRLSIESMAKERGFLHCKIYLNDVVDNSGEEFQETKGKTLHEIEREYLEKQKYDFGTIQLAQEVMNLLGTSQTPKEMEINQEKCVTMIDKFLGLKT